MPFFGPTRAALAAAAARGADIIPSLRLVLTAEALTAPPPAYALELNAELDALCTAARELAACRAGVPTLDVGERTDVMDMCPKRLAIAHMVRIRDTFTPDAEEHKLYDRIYREVYRRYYRAVTPLHKLLGAITRKEK